MSSSLVHTPKYVRAERLALARQNQNRINGKTAGARGRDVWPLVPPTVGFRGRVDFQPRIPRPGHKTGLVSCLCVAAPSRCVPETSSTACQLNSAMGPAVRGSTTEERSTRREHPVSGRGVAKFVLSRLLTHSECDFDPYRCHGRCPCPACHWGRFSWFRHLYSVSGCGEEIND